MKLLDLFSGIGGFSLGLNRAGFETVAFCEIDPWCRRVLAKHWTGVPAYDDIRDLSAARLRADGIERIDAICGGFPCQDVSLAGKGAGLEGERSGLWREYARLLGELRPRYAIVENVGALRARGLAAVLADLAALGFDAEWHAIPAAAVGAPHLRDRVWIIAATADADSFGVRDESGRRGGQGGASAALAAGDGAARVDPNADGQRRERLGIAQHRDKQGAPGSELERLGAWGRRPGSVAAHTAGPGSPELRGLFGRLARSLAEASTPWPRTPEPPLRGVDDGLSSGVDGRGRARLIRASDRNRTKALGNAVVPLVPELIGRALLEAA